MNIKLSILIMSIPSRLPNPFVGLLTNLINQIGNREDVELLTLLDNRKRSIAEKRNALIDLAQGEYVTFIDDDDDITPIYIAKILPACVGVDLITFHQRHLINGLESEVEYRVGNPRQNVDYLSESKLIPFARQCPHPKNIWRKQLIINERFTMPDKYTEDYDWADRVIYKVESETHLDEVLYIYNWHYNVSTQTNKNQ